MTILMCSDGEREPREDTICRVAPIIRPAPCSCISSCSTPCSPFSPFPFPFIRVAFPLLRSRGARHLTSPPPAFFRSVFPVPCLPPSPILLARAPLPLRPPPSAALQTQGPQPLLRGDGVGGCGRAHGTQLETPTKRFAESVDPQRRAASGGAAAARGGLRPAAEPLQSATPAAAGGGSAPCDSL